VRLRGSPRLHPATTRARLARAIDAVAAVDERLRRATQAHSGSPAIEMSCRRDKGRARQWRALERLTRRNSVSRLDPAELDSPVDRRIR
jgi:hypothetical protein